MPVPGAMAQLVKVLADKPEENPRTQEIEGKNKFSKLVFYATHEVACVCVHAYTNTQAHTQ